MTTFMTCKGARSQHETPFEPQIAHKAQCDKHLPFVRNSITPKGICIRGLVLTQGMKWMLFQIILLRYWEFDLTGIAGR